MFRTRSMKLLAAMLLVALLLFGCTAAPAVQGAGETGADTLQPTNVPEEAAPAADAEPAAFEPPVVGEDGTVTVSTVDELLYVIGPDRTIRLEAGDYALTDAADYGQESQSPYYTWEEVFDGYALSIAGVDNLSIIGDGADTVEIHTAPRYAHVLSFLQCSFVTISGVTAGHTDGPGSCAGAVLYFEDTDDVSVAESDLYGCGTIGIEAHHCERIEAEDCTIRDCSIGALTVTGSRGVQLQNCLLLNCGDAASPAQSVLDFAQSEDIALINCTVEANNSYMLLSSSYCVGVQLLGCEFTDNQILGAAFCADWYGPIVEGCAFTENTVDAWYPYETESGTITMALSKDGTELEEEDILAMQRRDVAYEAPEASTVDTAGDMREVHAANADEFLAGIASNTTLYVPDGVLDLSTASNYGAFGSDYYMWSNEYDGPALVISGVTNFHIVGSGAENASIVALPRYANVLSFRDCADVSLAGVTLGHIEAPGTCSGGVLFFEGTYGVGIRDCGLFGCGTVGIAAYMSSGFTVERTVIYDCSESAVSFSSCWDVAFTDCDLHDCGIPMLVVFDSENVTFDGEVVPPTVY